MRRPVAALAVVALLAAGTAEAYVPEKTRRREIEAAARRATTVRPARGATLGFVARRGGRTLFAMNEDRPFTPASLIKLFTTAAALRRFGPDHRFVTRVVARRRAKTVGRLYVVGGGDPTLATRRYRRIRFFPKRDDEDRTPAFAGGSPSIEDLARAVARSGVRRVTGGITYDDTIFDRDRVPDGWPSRYLRGEPESGYVTGLSINEGRGDPEGQTLLKDPPRSAADELRRALRGAGVQVEGSLRRARAPTDAVELGRVESPPLSEIVFFVNRWSVNFPAEMLLKGLGARFGGAGSTGAGAGVVRRTLAGLGVPLDGFRMTDGSGLSLLDRAAPESIVRLLEWILQSDAAAVLRESLPVAGESGTLVERMGSGPTKGNLRGKTGLLRGARALAGWVDGADGVPIVYVSIFNEARAAGLLTAALDLIGRALASFPAA